MYPQTIVLFYFESCVCETPGPTTKRKKTKRIDFGFVVELTFLFSLTHSLTNSLSVSISVASVAQVTCDRPSLWIWITGHETKSTMGSSCQWNKWITTTLQKMKRARERKIVSNWSGMSIVDNDIHLVYHILELERRVMSAKINIPHKYHVHSPLQIGSAFVFCVTNYYESQFVFTSNGNNKPTQ